MSVGYPLPVPLRRLAIPALVALVLIAASIDFVGMLGRWPVDFATLYAATLAASRSGANVYDYAILAQLNATHHYVAGAIYPFTYPPFVLFVARPLAALPFGVARVLWSALIVLATLAIAALLTDALGVMLKRRMDLAPGTRGVFEASSVRLGGWALPVLPFSVAAAALLLALPPADARYWGSGVVVTLCLVALAVDGTLHGRPIVACPTAGFAAGLAGPHPLVGVAIVLVFVTLALMQRRAWRGYALGALAAALVAYPPTAGSPGDLRNQYAAYLTQRSLLGGVYTPSWHNASLQGLAATILTMTEHTGTKTFLEAARVISYLGWAVGAITATALLAGAFAVWRGERTVWRWSSAWTAWPAMAVVTAAYALVPTVVWPFDAMLVVFAALALLGFAVSDARDARLTTWATQIAGAAGLVALLLCIIATSSGGDWQDLPQGTLAMALYLLRPLAGVLVWGAACLSLASLALAALRRGHRLSGTARDDRHEDRVAESTATAE